MKIPVEHARDVDLNTASEEQLATDVGLGVERARRIVESRPLRDWQDVENIEGLTSRVVDELRRAGATLGDPEHADVKKRSDEHRERDRLDQSARADVDEGVPTDRAKGPQREIT